MKMPTSYYAFKHGQPTKLWCTSVGVPTLMGMTKEDIQVELNKYPNNEFFVAMEKAEAKATEIGQKILKMIEAAPHSFMPGWSFTHWDKTIYGGYRFYFDRDTNPEYVI